MVVVKIVWRSPAPFPTLCVIYLHALRNFALGCSSRVEIETGALCGHVTSESRFSVLRFELTWGDIFFFSPSLCDTFQFITCRSFLFVIHWQMFIKSCMFSEAFWRFNKLRIFLTAWSHIFTESAHPPVLGVVVINRNMCACVWFSVQGFLFH